jgi:hypothetical protein
MIWNSTVLATSMVLLRSPLRYPLYFSNFFGHKFCQLGVRTW